MDLPLLGQQVLIRALPLLGQQPADSIINVLPQYGAIGVIAALALFGVVRLFNRLVETHKSEIERIEASHRSAIERADSAYDREVARGDRLEGELRDLNKLVNDKLAGELVKATDAIREALEMTRDRRRQ
ncbi:hypothetical protein [Nocardia wallacei]|uniref:hypothetical protein n=1 Tax=Nocardia wallacei TaxID=480035 RepID=UPI0024551E0A|nr:hypothetical protein [Nocardia wallacei]